MPRIRYRQGGEEHSVRVHPADMFIAEADDAHVAHPIGEARIPVVERKRSA